MDPRAGPPGRGWRLSYDTRLHWRAADGRVQIAQADGSRMDFRCEAACRPLDQAPGRLERRTGTELPWRWRWPDGHALHFDGDGRLVRIDDAGGHHVRIVRDTTPGATAGAIVEVVDEAGNALRLAYETGPAGVRLTRVDTPYGRYTYRHDRPPARGIARIRPIKAEAARAGLSACVPSCIRRAGNANTRMNPPCKAATPIC